MILRNRQFGSQPVVVHAHGPLETKPHWQPIRDVFFSQERRAIGAPDDLTVLTCNNGHDSMGLLERSLDRLGVPYVVTGQGIDPWVNARDKPRSILQAAWTVRTTYLLYADSRDAIVLDDPRIALERFRTQFRCDLVFGADRINWPPLERFREFEDAVAGEAAQDFRYLNGGVWIGRTEFCREFFADAAATPPLPEMEVAEQGILKQLFPKYYPKVQLDYGCTIFQNIGFLFGPVLEVVP
ncbi:MAG TPA: hypothetical protein VI670_16465 [Thermoanaerobaculia bacterium]|jgi:hypothetical protein